MSQVRSSDRDDPRYFYGDLYGDAPTSTWKACGECAFVHQNPRPSEEALQAFFDKGEYHRQDLPKIFSTEQGYRRFCGSSYFTSKVDYFCERTGLTQGKVFDVGCGTGCMLSNLHQRGLDVAGCEPDPVHCATASKYIPGAEVDRYLLTAENRPEGKFDAVISHHVFEHFANLDEAVESMVSILKPGGYIFTVVPTYYMNRTRHAVRAMNAGHYSMFTHHTMNRLFAKAGLEEVCHSYRGAWAWSDELWHLARFTGRSEEEIETPLESAEEVCRYVNEQTLSNERLGMVGYVPLRALWRVADGARRRLRSLVGGSAR